MTLAAGEGSETLGFGVIRGEAAGEGIVTSCVSPEQSPSFFVASPSSQGRTPLIAGSPCLKVELILL